MKGRFVKGGSVKGYHEGTPWPDVGQQVGGTHPTELHSCSLVVCITYFRNLK